MVPKKTDQIGEGQADLIAPLAEKDSGYITAPDVAGTVGETKSQPHDVFDENLLIELVPSGFHARAKELLQKIHEFPMELNFGTDGTVFIDSQSIPNSDIKIIFPALFIRKNKKVIPGLKELATKLASMGFGHLFFKGILKSLKRPNNYKISESAIDYKKHKNWWYIG